MTSIPTHATPTAVTAANRPTTPAPAAIAVKAPPALPTADAGSSVLMALLPMLGGLGSFAYLATNQSGTKGLVTGGLFLAASLVFGAATVWRARAARTRALRDSRRSYLAHLAAVRTATDEAAIGQVEAAERIHPHPDALVVVAAEGSRVGERPDDSPPFLVRVGVGTGPLSRELNAPDAEPGTREDPVCAARRGALLHAVRQVPGLPICLGLGLVRRVHIEGPSDQARALGRAMLLQDALWYGATLTAVGVLASPEALVAWDFVKWLPHARSLHRSDAAGPRRLMSSSGAELAALHAGAGEVAAGAAPVPRAGADCPRHLLLVVEDAALTSPLSDLPGMTVLTVGGTPPPASETAHVLVVGRRGLPAESQPVSVRVIPAGGAPVDGWADQMSVAGAEAVARRLAAWGPGVDPRGGAAGAASPELADLLGLGDLRRLRMTRAWAPRAARDRLRVPIGVDDSGAPICLDLKESAEDGMGPHGLVIGATGSGKSELLRTIVAGLALTHSPEELNLILVDFKGPATFAGLGGMPHVSAVITNLRQELTLVNRMHDALSGEMVRRQEALRAAGNISSLRDYNTARSAGRELDPLPTLVVVCDEFTELLTVKPEFAELFVAMGRLGRSLGIHLLLASQRLEEGRLRGLDSHLAYRIALRTFSAGESRAVIGEPDAYELPSIPGLGYLKTGPSTRVRFRAAYVSGPADLAGSARPSTRDLPPIVPFRAAEVRGEPRRPKNKKTTRARPRGGATVVDLAVAAMRGQGPAAHQVWLPPLDAADTFDALLPDLTTDSALGLHSPAWRARGPMRIPLGAVDRPKERRRDVLVADLSGPGGHVAVVGGPQTGKSTVLRSLVAGLALTHTPAELQVFVLDFGGGTFAGMRDLAHVAAVAPRSDPDVVRRICAEVATIADERERYFRLAGIDSVAAYRSRRAADGADDGYGDVVLVVDGWATLRTEFDGLEVSLQALAERALPYGVHLLTSATRWLDYRTAMRDLLGTRVELKLGDPMDSEIDRALAASIPAGRPGRGITPDGYQILAALPRIDGSADARTLADGVEHLVLEVNAGWSGPPGPKLRLLPDTVTLAELRSAADEPASRGILLGLTERSLRPVGLDPVEDAHLLVYGDGRSGKSAFLS